MKNIISIFLILLLLPFIMIFYIFGAIISSIYTIIELIKDIYEEDDKNER